jgi:hypothetical protein
LNTLSAIVIAFDQFAIVIIELQEGVIVPLQVNHHIASGYRQAVNIEGLPRPPAAAGHGEAALQGVLTEELSHTATSTGPIIEITCISEPIPIGVLLAPVGNLDTIIHRIRNPVRINVLLARAIILAGISDRISIEVCLVRIRDTRAIILNIKHPIPILIAWKRGTLCTDGQREISKALAESMNKNEIAGTILGCPFNS